MTDDERFTIWLNERLRDRRMTQRMLAMRTGIDHSTISRIVSGVHQPKLATAVKIARVLGTESFLEVFGD